MVKTALNHKMLEDRMPNGVNLFTISKNLNFFLVSYNPCSVISFIFFLALDFFDSAIS